MAVHPSGRFVATVCRPDKYVVEVWDLVDGKRISMRELDIDLVDFDRAYTRLTRFHPAGTHLYCNRFMINLENGSADEVIQYSDRAIGHVVSEGAAAVLYGPEGNYYVAVHRFADGGQPATVEAMNCGELRSVLPLGLTPLGDRLLLLGKSPEDKDVNSPGNDTRVDWSLVWYDIKARKLEQPRRISHAGRWGVSALSPDGTTLAVVGGASRIELWDVAGGQNDRVLRGHEEEIKSLAFAPDGKMLASDAYDGLRLWDISRGVETEKSPIRSTGFATPAFLNSSGSLALIEDGQIYCVHGPSGRFKGHYGLETESIDFGWSATGAELIAFCEGDPQGGVAQIDLTSGNTGFRPCDEKFIELFSVNRIGGLGVAMTGGGNYDNILLFDSNTSRFRAVALEGQIEGRSFNRPFWVGDGNVFGFYFEKNNSKAHIGLVDAKTRRPVRTIELETLVSGREFIVTASPSADLFAVGNGLEGKVHLIDATRSEVLREWNICRTGEDSRGIRKLQFSPDGSLLFALLERKEIKGEYEDLRVWSVDSGAEFPLPDLPAITEGGRVLTAIDLAPDGKMLAVGTDNGSIGLWKIGSDRISEDRVIAKACFAAPFQIRFSPDGAHIAATSYGIGRNQLSVWRTNQEPQATNAAEQLTLKDAVPYRTRSISSPPGMNTSKASPAQKRQVDPNIIAKLSQLLTLESEIRELAKSSRILTTDRLPPSKVGDEYIVLLKPDTPQGTVWGSGPYTLDSNLRSAAIHAGVLSADAAGIVLVVCVESPESFSASSRNGVSSNSYGRFGLAFEVYSVTDDSVSESRK